jgi:multiple sugar transport system permease protein
MTRTHPLLRLAMTVALWSFVFFLAFPLVWLILTSFKPTAEIIRSGAQLWPETFTLENYRAALFQERVLQTAWNTFKIAVASSLLTLAIATPAAYVLARRPGGINKPVVGWILVSQTFPVILIIVPLFMILSRLGLGNTHAGLILVYTVWSLPFVLWMLRGYIRNVPVEIEHSAAIDGANHLQILTRILIPLILPGLVATGLYGFINAWNEFFFALVLVKSPDLQTIQVNLARFRGVEGLARWGPLAAGSVLATLPTLVLFAFLQRGLVSGLLSGGVKQ